MHLQSTVIQDAKQVGEWRNQKRVVHEHFNDGILLLGMQEIGAFMTKF